MHRSLLFLLKWQRAPRGQDNPSVAQTDDLQGSAPPHNTTRVFPVHETYLVVFQILNPKGGFPSSITATVPVTRLPGVK